LIDEVAAVRGASSIEAPTTTSRPTRELTPKLTQNERPNRAGGFGGGAGCSSLAHFQQNSRDGWLVSPQFGQMTAASVELEAAAGQAEAGGGAGGGGAAGAGFASGVGAASDLPQLPQNSAPDSLLEPQNGHVTMRHRRLRRGVRRRRPRRSDGRQVRG
jgi:hypothetical protein